MDFKLSSGAEKVYLALKNAGYRADVVGGSVRDFLLGLAPHDFDMTTGATPDEMLMVFSSFRVIKTGLKHGTLTVISDGEAIEVTTYRNDGGYLDHRHPEKVTFSDNLLDDLSRRDFTVNAMCYHPDFGITDHFGGREDLKNRIIRCVGDPYLRFEEDALRILRALRFAAVLGFSVEEETAKAIHEEYMYLSDISAERIYAEWRKLLSGVSAVSVLKEFSDVVAFLFPHVELTVPECFVSTDFRLRMMQLFWQDQNRVSHFEEICRRLKTEKSFLEYGSAIFEAKPISSLPEKGELLRTSFALGKERARDFLVLSDAFDKGERTKRFDLLMEKNPVTTLSELAADGKDLAKIGLSGQEIGRALTMLLFAVMDEKVENKKENLLEYYQKNVNNH